MGVDVSAVAGFGYLIPIEKIIPNVKTTVQSCEHPERVGNTFCPKCGKKVGQTVFSTSDLRMTVIDRFYDADIPQGYILKNADESAHFFLGWGKEKETYDDDPTFGFSQPPSADLIKAVCAGIVDGMKSEYEQTSKPPWPDNLLDESKYGFYVFVRYS